MLDQSLLTTYKRYQSLRSDKITSLPIAVIMPHGACNCKCVMCDIWKGNKDAKQLEEEDIVNILESLRILDTKLIAMSGGEALLNRNFFRFCEIIKKEGIKISLLSTGLTIGRNAENIIKWVDEVIVSVDGDELRHDEIRNIPGAFQKVKEGISIIKTLKPDFPIKARCVIHNLNFKHWDKIIIAAKELGVDQISFLPADVTSHAFNREMAWDQIRQSDVLIKEEELGILEAVLDNLNKLFANEFSTRFIAESPEKLYKIYQYYAAHHGLMPFPYKKCNAPWVSTVIEADGTVRPCFFLESMGNIKNQSLIDILNSERGINTRKELDMDTNPTCIKCVCYNYLSPRTSLV